MDRRIGHRTILLPVNQPDPDAGRAQSLRGVQKRAVKLVFHASFDANPTLPRQMPVKQDIHLDSALHGVYQGIDDTISVLAQEVADQE